MKNTQIDNLASLKEIPLTEPRFQRGHVAVAETAAMITVVLVLLAVAGALLPPLFR